MLIFKSRDMRNIIIGLLIGLTGITFTSCEKMFGDFLEKAPGVDVTEDSLFTSKAQAMLLLASCYEQSMISPWPSGQYKAGSDLFVNEIYNNIEIHMGYADEGWLTASWFISHSLANGSMTVGKFHDFFWKTRWTALRMLHTMLDGIDRVPEADEAYKTQIRAEARFLRAILYFDMFKLYGGVPIVDRKFSPAEVEEMKIPRSSVEETVNFILQDLDFAITNLPASYPTNMRGRATSLAARALKSRTLLYAASPLYNTATPVLSMADPVNNKMIIYGNYDVNRWQQAADAAKAVLDNADAGGIHLIEDKGVDKNYRFVWEQPDNEEIILADKQSLEYWKKQRPWQYYLPDFMGSNGPQLPHSFVAEFYDKRDGTPMVWGTDGQLAGKYEQLDYRFSQAVGYNGFYWSAARGVLNMAKLPAPAGTASKNNVTGYWIKKHIPDNVNGQGNQVPRDFVRFRLAEFYLNYAEALNEAQGPVPAAYQAVNRIRTRSGMPNLPIGLTKEEFRKRVQKERAIELFAEDHRWWDIRRNLLAWNYLNGERLGLNVFKNEPITNPLTFRYTISVFQRRTWLDKFYHYHFTTEELNKGYLVQNPGW